MPKLTQDMEYEVCQSPSLRFVHTDQKSFKNYILKLDIVLTRLSTTVMIINLSESRFFEEDIEYI
jgi:hypothetical protein